MSGLGYGCIITQQHFSDQVQKASSLRGLLNKFNSTPPFGPPPLPLIQHGQVVLTPASAIRARLSQVVWQVLIQWKDRPTLETTWEGVDQFKLRYPLFQLEDKLFSEGGRGVRYGITYQRRHWEQKSAETTSENRVEYDFFLCRFVYSQLYCHKNSKSLS